MAELARVGWFVAAFDRSVAAADHPALADALDRMIETARAAWPGFTIDDREFVAFVAARVPDGLVVPAIDNLPAADLWLAYGCLRGHPAALRAFEDHAMIAVEPALARAGFARDTIDEVKQRLRVKLFTAADREPRIVDYLGRGGLRAWLRVVAMREALNLVRKQQPASLDDLSAIPLASDDPELEHIKARYRGEFRSAIASAATTLEPRARTLLRQYYLDQTTLAALAKIYGVHLATVARWIEHARSELLAATRRAFIRDAKIPHHDLDSVLRLIESQLEVSAGALLSRDSGD